MSSMDTEQLSTEPQPWEFRSKPAWQRLIVMLGGIIVNVITGIIIFVILVYNNGETYFSRDQIIENGIVAYEYGESIGFQTGDKILDVNGQPYQSLNELSSGSVLLSENGYYTVDRNGEQVKIEIPRRFLSIHSIPKKPLLSLFRFVFPLRFWMWHPERLLRQQDWKKETRF